MCVIPDLPVLPVECQSSDVRLNKLVHLSNRHARYSLLDSRLDYRNVK